MNIPNDEVDRNRNSTKVSLFTKLVLSTLILTFLSLSIWLKIEYFKETGLWSTFESRSQELQPAEMQSKSGIGSEYSTQTEDVYWSAELYYFIREHTFSSSAAPNDAKKYLTEKGKLGIFTTALPQAQNGEIQWSVGFGRFQTFRAATDSILSYGADPDTIEILSTEYLSPLTIPSGGETGQFYYVVRLGEFDSHQNLESAYEKWKVAGFKYLEIVEDLAYFLTFGRYNSEIEAKLIAEIIQNGTKKPVSVTLIHQKD